MFVFLNIVCPAGKKKEKEKKTRKSIKKTELINEEDRVIKYTYQTQLIKPSFDRPGPLTLMQFI